MELDARETHDSAAAQSDVKHQVISSNESVSANVNMPSHECTDYVPVSYTHLTLPTNREV